MTILTSMLVFLSALSAGTNFPASMSEKEKTCLLTVWQRTLPSDEEKQFDMDNDVDIDGLFYSCENNISASELQNSLTKIKMAIKNDDEQTFASMLSYPLYYLIKKEKPDNKGSITESRTINSPSEIDQHYKNIVTPEFKDVMACAAVNKFSVLENFDILLARGFIHFELDKTYDEVKISGVGVFVKNQQNWYEKYCQ
ncbi:MAG: hypothetical protein R3D86_13705 [Emcibacteraceae bacterium]